MQTLRIFISSPGDVAEERDKAKQVIADLQRRYEDQVALVPVLWEDLAIPSTASFQEGIDFVLAEQHRIDIAVFILWSRLGSPLGIAITKPDGSPYRSGTEREFDLMLAAFEKSGGKTPIMLAYTRHDDESFSDRLDATEHDDDALEELLKQRKLAKQFVRERFQDEEGHNIRAFHSYREPVGFAQRLDVHLRGAIEELLKLDSAAIWPEPPYRSLEVFDIRHAPIFCGRDEETCDLLQRLRDQDRTGCAFACIVGASGSGKSSLARAGVAATLMQRSFDDGVKQWRAAVLLPSLASGDLFLALARSLAGQLPELGQGVGGVERFAKRIEDNHEAATDLLEAAFKTVSDRLDGSLRLLLVLDQMEELWTDRSITTDQREKFLKAVEALGRSGRLCVLATLRSDFYPQAQLSEAFLRMKGERGHFDLTPPGTAALQELIALPARRAGLRFERDERTARTLDQRILEAATPDPAALPLLQYALSELYERRDKEKRLLTFAAYDAMGGVEGALAQRAAETFGGLPGEAKVALDELLPLLVSVDIAGEQNAVRRRAPLGDLNSTPARQLLTERLIQARFLTTDEQSGLPIATLTHEALLRRWDHITTWINMNRDLLRMRARIEQYQAMWKESGQETSRLLPAGLPLEEGRRLLGATTQVLNEQAKHFVLASSAHHDEQQRRATRIRRLAFAVLSVLTALALVGGGIAWRMKNKAEEARIEAEQLLWEASKSDSEESLRKLAAEGDWNTAVAYGARALRIRPGNAAAARRLFGHTLLAGVAPSRILAHDGAVTQARYLPDGALLTVSGGKLRRWESADGRWTSREIFAAGKGEKILAFSPVGDRLCILAPDGSARLWDVSARAAGPTLGDTKPSGAVFSPDGGRLLTMDGGRLLKMSATSPVAVWDARSGDKVASLSFEGDAVTVAALAPDGSSILTGTNRGTIRCWKPAGDGASWEVEWALEDSLGNSKIRTQPRSRMEEARWVLEDALTIGIVGLTISPDGSRFAAVSGDGAAACWSMPTRFQVATLKGEQAAGCVAYSGDGSMVATGGPGGSVQLWERASGKPLAFLRGHRGAITELSFSGDGRFLLTGSDDGTARLWEMARCPLDAPEAKLGEVVSGDIPPVPGWVYESLLPFLCGKELDREGKISDLSVKRQLEAQAVVEQQLEKMGANSGRSTGPWDRFLDWKFLSDSRTRPISPDFAQSVPEYVEKNLRTTNKLADEARIRAVWLVAPDHPLVQWALGETHSGGVWGGWLRDRALLRLAEPGTGALYGAETVARWAKAPADVDASYTLHADGFINSLGMTFAPVAVSGGKTVLFSVWETRVKDYAAYAGDQTGVNGFWKDHNYKGQKVSPTEDCPVAAVSWEDADGFCKWLTAREQELGNITKRQRYRLPTDEEWSWAVGIGEEEEEALRGRSPKDKDSKVGAYPWGTLKYPPLDDKGKPLGNYADSEFKEAFPEFPAIEGYTDGYATTSPVGSFPAGANELSDMGGNVWEWCEDWYDPAEKKMRVLRGASWSDLGSVNLLSSCRFKSVPGKRDSANGFRCVLAEDSSAH